MNKPQEYKGVYYNGVKARRFFEGGAHFRFRELCLILEKLSWSSKYRAKSNKKVSIPKDHNIIFINKQQKTRNVLKTAEKTSNKGKNSLSINVDSFFMSNYFQSKNLTSTSALNEINKRMGFSSKNKDESSKQRMDTMSYYRSNTRNESLQNTKAEDKKCLYIKVNEIFTNNALKTINLSTKNKVINKISKHEENSGIDIPMANKANLNTLDETAINIENKTIEQNQVQNTNENLSKDTKMDSLNQNQQKEFKIRVSVDKFNLSHKKINRKDLNRLSLGDDATISSEEKYQRISTLFTQINKKDEIIKSQKEIVKKSLLWSFDNGS